MGLYWRRGDGESRDFNFLCLGGVIVGGVRLTDDHMLCFARMRLPGIRPQEAFFDSGAAAMRFVEDAARMWFATAGHPLPEPTEPAAAAMPSPPADWDNDLGGGLFPRTATDL
jgi:hypothetical protein